MGEKREEKFNFVYKSYKGDVRFDLESITPKEPAHLSLKVSFDDRYPIEYAYQYGDGLIRVDGFADKKKNTNILGKFLQIKHDDFDGYVNFFNDNGFLYELDLDRFIKVEISDVVKISKRLQALIDLINLVNEPLSKRKTMEIFELAFLISIDDGWNINITNNEHKRGPHHFLKELMQNPGIYSEEKQLTREEVSKGIITVEDSLYKEYELSSIDYRNIQTGDSQSPGWQDTDFINITYLYVNDHTLSKEQRKIVDCVFHFLYKIGIPKNPILGDIVEYYEEPKYAAIDDELKESIISFAKYVIKVEIDEMIKGIKPIYNEETMKPDWKIDSLLSAMYFSIFFMDSKMEMYRRCSHCGSLFLVKRSSSTKIYCSPYCRNNAQQAKHRLKNRKA